MSELSKAVFFSYASQDAEAAKRICDALRAAGVEVWFDAEGGLEHGDEWDAKIRRQIKECVLFIPIISANTQAREEGYFRIEWELAAQRALGIASGVAFILPVVIDDTREPDALVPDRFRAVQWTRLPGGVVPAEVRARFLKLWSHRTGALKHEAAARGQTPEDKGQTVEAGRPRPAERGEGTAPTFAGRNRSPLVYALIGLGLLVAGFVAFETLKPRRSPEELAKLIGQARALGEQAARPATPAATEAKQLLAQAWEQLNRTDLYRGELEIADGLCQRAAGLEPGNPDVWATWSQVDSWFVYHDLDNSPARRESARTKATRALNLAPRSYEARLAEACYLLRATAGSGNGRTNDFAAATEQSLRELGRERPADPRSLFALGILLRNTGRYGESAAAFDRMAQLPGCAATAFNEKGWVLWFARDRRGALEAADRSFEAQPFFGNFMLRLVLALQWTGDLDSAKATLAQIPPALLSEDAFVTQAIRVHWSRHDPEAMLRALDAAPRPWFSSNNFNGPRHYLIGVAQRMAGHPEAAQLAWHEAQHQVEQRLEKEPDSPALLRWKAILLGTLGRRTEAEDAARLAESLDRAPQLDVLIELGQNERALALIEQQYAADRSSNTWALLQFDPQYDGLRGEPRFQALLARAQADPQRNPHATTAAVMPDEKSVAVLAFANLSDDKENEYFSDGISEELLTVLQKIPGLHVAARTSSFYFKGKNATVQEIGQKLGVARLVEGSVRKAGSQVRISVQLSRTDSGEQLWSDSYTRDLKDVFALQTELAQTIVTQLRGRLAGDGAGAAGDIAAQVLAAEKGGTTNPDAHQLFLQGRYYSNRFSAPDARKAIAMLQKAVDLDPGYARAWAALSQAGSVLGGYGDTRTEFESANQLARRAADRALTLAPDLAVAHLANAQVQLNYEFDWKGADQSFKRALALAPDDADIVNGATLLAYVFGRVDQAAALSQRALDLDPANPTVRVYRAFIRLAQQRYPEAEAEFRELSALNQASPWGHAGLSYSFVLSGRLDDAVHEAEAEQTEWARLFALAVARAARGEGPAADAALAQLIKTNADIAAYQIAEVYAFRRDNDHAFEWLERAYRQRDSGLAWIRTDECLARLSNDPRWPVFLHKLGLADDQLP